jgi:hypothetical protein
MLAWSQESAFTASACNGPDLLLAPSAGVLADRWNRHWMLVITQTLAQALILAALVLAGTIHIEEIVTLSLLLGPVNAFDMPTGRSFLVQLITPNGHLFLHPECGTRRQSPNPNLTSTRASASSAATVLRRARSTPWLPDAPAATACPMGRRCAERTMACL